MAADSDAIRTSFVVPSQGYDLLIGRYLPTLAPAFIATVGFQNGMRALDVGCGPGGLTTELSARLGADSVTAIDPSEPFVMACRARNPDVDVRLGVAERLPFDDACFDATLACLVVGFMTDAAEGVREMARVTRPGGIVAACFWNYAQMPLINTFFTAAAEIDPAEMAEARRLGTREGEIASLLEGAGLTDIEEREITATAAYTGFDDWWSPIPLGVGPPGAFYRSINDKNRETLRNRCFDLLSRPSGPFSMTAHAWRASGSVPVPSGR
jgi:ubiquinone/menaquinone biosynthesis C-methylase UbiE